MLSCVVAVLLAYHMAAAAYPLYTAKSRYGRSLASWPPLPIYYPPRATRPLYYPDSDYYYPQDPYYPVYQSVVPSYYLDQQRPYYYGYDEVTEPVEDLPEDIMAEDERGEDLPYGQETWFQDSTRSSDSNADANARFLQNLIIAQMYNDASKKYPAYSSTGYSSAGYGRTGYGSTGYPLREEEESDRWVYGEPVKTSKQKTMTKEDEDVRELKNLVRGPSTERRDRADKKARKDKDNIFAAQRGQFNEWDEFRSSYKRSNDLKFSSAKSRFTSPTSSPEVTPQPIRGQKEEVLPRPANPVRTPDFEKFVSSRSSARDPSVYDTIKKLLHMEEKLDQESSASRLQKRSYIPSEESLVAQLGGLKKMA